MEQSKYLESITLATEIDKKVAFANVKIGEVTIRGIAVWRSGNGQLRVFFPRNPIGPIWQDCVDISADVRSEIEAEVIAAYRLQKEEAKHKSQPK